MSKSSTSSGGISFLGMLAIVFIGLKLTGHITWSWWLVTAPLWGGVVLFISILLLFALIGGLAAVLK